MAKLMVSRITGQLQLYELTRTTNACDPFTEDLNALKIAIQDSLDTEGIDAQVESLKKIREPKYDYLFVDTWLPVEATVLDVYGRRINLIPPLIVTLLLGVILTIVATAAIVVIAQTIWQLAIPHPHCSECGQKFADTAELAAHRKTTHPDLPQFQCPYCGMSFNTAEELNEHIPECPLRTEENWWIWLIVGVAMVAGIVIFGPTIARAIEVGREEKTFY